MSRRSTSGWCCCGALGAALALSCAPPPRRPTAGQLRYRAVFDLGCPPGRLTLYPIDERTRAVTGCGRRLVYLEQCDGVTGLCSYRLDTPSVAQLGWPQAWAPRATPGERPGDWRSRAATPRGLPTSLFGQEGPPDRSHRPLPTQLFAPSNEGQPAQPAASTARPAPGPKPAATSGPRAPRTTTPAAKPTPSSTIIRDFGF